MRFHSYEARTFSDYVLAGKAIDQQILANRLYEEHLHRIATALPSETAAFALAAWYHDFNSHDCPHASSLAELQICCPDHATPRLQITIKVLGAYWDRELVFKYTDVAGFAIEGATAKPRGLGDWISDELDLSEDGLVSHEIQWEHGKPWLIRAKSVSLTVMDWNSPFPLLGQSK